MFLLKENILNSRTFYHRKSSLFWVLVFSWFSIKFFWLGGVLRTGTKLKKEHTLCALLRSSFVTDIS